MAFDTKTITLHQDDLGFLNDCEFDWSQSQIQAIIKHAFDSSEIGVQQNFRSFGTNEVIQGTSYSKVAYVETDSGYFFVTEDMIQHIIVTFSRWD